MTEPRTLPTESLESNGGDDRPRLLVFYGKTCGYSRRADAHLAQVLQRRRNYSLFRLTRIEVGEQPRLASRFAIETTPTLVVIDAGEIQVRLERPANRRSIEDALAPWLRTAVGFRRGGA